MGCVIILWKCPLYGKVILVEIKRLCPFYWFNITTCVQNVAFGMHRSSSYIIRGIMRRCHMLVLSEMVLASMLSLRLGGAVTVFRLVPSYSSTCLARQKLKISESLGNIPATIKQQSTERINWLKIIIYFEIQIRVD